MNVMLNTVGVMLGMIVGMANSAAEKLPTDVAKYVEQREGCDHFRGEVPDPPDAQRMREIEREIRELCTGTDKELVKLKRKYAKDQAIMTRLNEFEENIEHVVPTSRP